MDAHTGNILFRYDNIKRACPTASGAPAYVYGYRLDGEDGSFVSTIGWLETGGNYYFYSWDNLWGVYDLDVGDCEQNSSNNWVYLDQPAVSAGYNFEYVQDYVSSVLGRNSFDDGGAFAWANIHLGTNYCNAYWNGSSFNFGDGDGTPYCKPLTVTDIAAHEYGHAITDYTSDLVYAYEPGALNEAYSDIMGTLVEFAYQPDGRGVYPDATPGYSDWLCGEDAWGPAAGDALRDLRDPQRYGQPSYYHGTYWYFGDLDNGGVHTNSGVANHAFYLLAEGAPAGDNDGHPHGEITGIGYVAAGEVAMRANMVYHVPTDQYAQAREHWISAAADLGYPTATVEQVWDAVGVGVDGGESFPSPSTVSLGLDYDAQRGGVWLAAEDGYVYLIDVDAPHSTLQTIDLVGIAVAADGNSDGACVLANGNILLADFNGDLTNIDDYLFEIDPNTNTLINYWPLDGSWNTSTDGTFIDTIIGVEIGPNGNAFVTSAFDNYIYEIALVPGLPGSWSTVAVHSATTVGVVLGIDRINCPNFNGWLVSDWNSTTVALLDESFATVASFPANHDSNTFNSGVTAIAVQDENPMNIWTVDFTTNYIGIFDSGITCGSEGGEGQWVLEAPIPHVFMDTVVVEYNNETFVLAGYGGEGQAYKYNPITDTWTRLADQPSPTVEYPVDGVLGYDGSGNPMIYIFPDTTSAQTNIMAYDINSNSWSTVPLSGGFTARWAADIAYDPDNNLCYISGGAAAPGAGDLNELWVFNPATNTFTQKASFTTPRDFHASCYYNGKIYIAGGYDSTTGPLSSTQVYNIATNTWSAENAELGALPDLWWGMGDALQESKLWLMGGVDGTGALVSRTGYFDLTSGSWVNAADLVEPVYRTEGDVQRGDPYLLAGSSGGFTPTAFNQHYLSPEQPTIDLLAADFGSPGLYTYDGTTWNRINSNNPAVLGAYSGKVVANFPGMGLYEYDGTSWKRINTNTGAQDMVAVGDTLYVDFGTAGLYQYNGSSWSRIVRMDASVLASFDGKLAVNFPGRGLYTYDGGWSRIARNDTAETMIGLGSLLYV
ncbi:MAG: M4 family metallopeptidase, partial [Syntrophobacterales bacterium]